MLSCPSTCVLLRARAMGDLLIAIGNLPYTVPSLSMAIFWNTHQPTLMLLICQQLGK